MFVNLKVFCFEYFLQSPYQKHSLWPWKLCRQCFGSVSDGIKWWMSLQDTMWSVKVNSYFVTCSIKYTILIRAIMEYFDEILFRYSKEISLLRLPSDASVGYLSKKYNNTKKYIKQWSQNSRITMCFMWIFGS